jgi:DNA-binding NtrC family response regulator
VSDGGDAGLVVLRAAAELQPGAETIMVTAHGDVPTARAAFKEGAFDFMEKPLDLAVFREVVNRAAERVLVRAEAGEFGGLVAEDGFEGIVAGSEPMRKILRTVKTVAASTIPVLITGESGTGKELIARAVHDHSPRAKRVRGVQLRGAEREPARGPALRAREGGVHRGGRLARGRVRVRRRGDAVPGRDRGHAADDAGEAAACARDGRCRAAREQREPEGRCPVRERDQPRPEQGGRGGFVPEDLFYRINGSHIQLPPLRERRDDIPRIIQHAIARFSEQMGGGQPMPEVTDAAVMRLTSFHWPGNVRQLLNVVQNMTVQAMGEAEPGRGAPARCAAYPG